ncbi:hypothetical protein FOXYSP1_16769 [Fusarium oxysporum f. sp. phaseoli]
MGTLITPPMPTRPFRAELLVAILTAHPALTSSLILPSSSCLILYCTIQFNSIYYARLLV